MELLVFFTGIIFYVYRFHPNYSEKEKCAYMFICINIPLYILVDHVFYQQNWVMMGFVMWSINSMFLNKNSLCAVLFIIALNTKQMAMFYFPPIFYYILCVNLYN